jgi:hypothetical protein
VSHRSWRRSGSAQTAPIPPALSEDPVTFAARLGNANGLSPDGLGLDHNPGGPEVPAILSESTGRPIEELRYALPELRSRRQRSKQSVHLSGLEEAARRRLACQHCTLARGAGDRVTAWNTHDDLVCHRHNRWLGSTLSPAGQVDLTAYPDSVTAIVSLHLDLGLNRLGYTLHQ